MNWRTLELVLIATVAACAQSSGQNRVPKPQPEQEKALDNALRHPSASGRFSGPFTMSPLRTLPLVTSSFSQRPREFVNTCVTPFLAIPFDADTDRAIHRELRPDTLNTDRMLTLKMAESLRCE